MPKRSRVRKGRNRSRRSNAGRKIAQVSSGIPVVRRIRGDPPPVKLSLNVSVKVTFDVCFKVWNSGTQPSSYSVYVATTPFENNSIDVSIANPADSNSIINPNFYLTKNEIFAAASTHVFGSYENASCTTDANYIFTQYAVQSVAVYAPVRCTSMACAMDFGPGMPGAYATDSGTESSRACVKMSTPRLYWDRRTLCQPETQGVGMFVCNLKGYSLPFTMNSGLGSYVDAVGRIDFTIHVRRAYDTDNRPSASSLVRVNDARVKELFTAPATA